MFYLTDEAIQHFIDEALREDVGSGDHSSMASIDESAVNRAQLIIKDHGILAGVDMALHIFRRVDPSLEVEVLIKDGETVHEGQIALTVSGKAWSILTAERLVLNTMQRMSGIATMTHDLTRHIRHTKAKLLDTRKTTPNFRLCEKWAVAIGGGVNHRYGLYDMIILKDNHVDYAGGISAAILSTQKYLAAKKLDLKIIIETRTLEEVKQAVETGGVYRIMLDNMNTSLMRDAIKIIGGKYPTEASGGVNKHNIRSIAECGVDFISVGALTHSVHSLDMSLKAF